MTNPTPRPALRKAEDATVHPAAPRPARSARATRPDTAAAPVEPPAAVPVPAAVPAEAPAPAKAAPRNPTKAAKVTRPRPVSPAAHSGGGKRKRKFGGSTSDHLRVDPETAPETSAGRKDPKGSKAAKPGAAGRAAAAAPAVVPAAEAPATSARPAKPSRKRARLATRDDLMQGKSVELDVEVPKALRKAARDRAKAEGLDVSTVVIDLLHGWVTRPPH